MEPSTLQADPKPFKPPRWWALVTLVAGAVGAFGAIAAGGKGTYDVAPFAIELRARPAALGKTELAVRPSAIPTPVVLPSAYAEAGTHNGPIVFRATVVGLDAEKAIPSDFQAAQDPHGLATLIGERGKDAARAFAIKLALLALAGGAAAGAVICFGRFRRIVGAALGGLLTFAVVGLLVQQTYDGGEFAKTRFQTEGPAPAQTPDGLIP